MFYFRIHGVAVWFLGTFDVVGVFMGYHGTCHILCNLWNQLDLLRIFCSYTTGIILIISL